MDTLKNIVITALVASASAALICLAVLVPQAEKAQPSQPGQQLGSLTGPDIPSPYLQWGGVTSYQTGTTFSQASTTVCSMQAPAATSTLVYASAAITTATTTATIWEFGKSNQFDATTTLVSQVASVASGALATINASTTATATLAQNIVFGPGQYLNVKFGGTQGITNSLVGTCKARWIVN